MRGVPLTVSILFCAITTFASEIREFDIKTLQRLGVELSRRDTMASRASDLVLAKHPELKTGPLLEWVTDLSDGGSVYWIVDTEPHPTPVYKVIGDRIEDIRGKPLPPTIQTRYNARRNAIKVVSPKLNGAYGAKYNFEVVDDPDGRGFLVYTLAAFSRTDAIYIGGHVRITVSADGSKVERIDNLSHGIIENKADAGHEMAGLGMAQAIDTKYPVETPSGAFFSSREGKGRSFPNLRSALDTFFAQPSQKKQKRVIPKRQPKGKKYVFASMPFAARYDDTFLVAIQPAALALRAVADRVDHSGRPGEVVSQIKKMIRRAKVVVADLSESRPNVCHEVGYAEAKNRPVIQICSTEIQKLPFNLRNNQTIGYSIGQSARLKSRIQKELAKYI